MPTFQFSGPDGQTYEVNGPDGATPEQAFGILQQHAGAPKSDAPMSWGKVGMQALSNAPASAGRFVQDMISPVVHPIETAKNLYHTGAGALDMAAAATNAAVDPYLPKSYQVLPEKTFGERYEHALKPADQGNVEAARAVGKSYVDRYGGVENIKRTLATDPVGVLGDVGGVLTLGGEGLARAPGVIGRAGEAVRAAGAINPVTGVAKVAKGVAGAIRSSPWAKAYEADRNPDIPAARAIRSAFQKDDGKGLSDQELQDAAARGQPVLAMDTGGGRATTRLARTASNFSPEAQEIGDRSIAMRSDTRHERTADYLSELQNFPDAHEQAKAIKNSARANNGVLYDRAMAKGAAGVWNDRLGELINHPWVRKAIPSALEESNAEAVLSGKPAMRDPFDVDAAGNLTLKKDAKGNTVKPTLEFWDALKKHIDDRVSGASASPTSRGEPNTVRIGSNLRDALLKETDAIVPEYKTARGVAQKFFGARDALQAGRDLATPGTRAAKMDNRVLADQLKSYSKAERALLQDGLMDQLSTALRGPNKRTILNDLKSSSNARNRMMMVMGPDKMAHITAWVHAEDMFDRFKTALRGNSTTMQQGDDMARMSVSPSHLLHIKTAMISYLEHMAKKIGVGLDEKVAKSVMEMLTSEDTERYDRAIKVIQKSKGLSRIFAHVPDPKNINAALRTTAAANNSRGNVTVD